MSTGGANGFSRRRFLEHGMAAAGAVAAPWVLPGSALGKDGTTTPATGSAWASSGSAGRGAGTCSAARGPICRAVTSAAAMSRPWPSATCNAARPRTARDGSSSVYAEKYGKGSYKGAGPTTISATCSSATTSTPCSSPRLPCRRDERDPRRPGGERHLLRKTHQRDDPPGPGRRRGGAGPRTGLPGGHAAAVRIRRQVPPGGRVGPRRPHRAAQAGLRLPGRRRDPGSPSTGRSKPIPPDVNWEAYLTWFPWFDYDGNTGAHRFGWGDVNWANTTTTSPSGGAGGDDTGPVEIRSRRREARPPLRQRHRDLRQPLRRARVGTRAGRLRRHRGLDYRPPQRVGLRPAGDRPRLGRDGRHGRVLLHQPLRQLPRMRPHAAADDLRRRDHPSREQPAPAGGIAMQIGRTLKWTRRRKSSPTPPTPTASSPSPPASRGQCSRHAPCAGVVRRP